MVPDNPRSSDAALIAFYDAGLDFPEICWKVVESGVVELFRAIDAQGNRVASAYIRGFRGASETNTAGCKQSADAACAFFSLNRNMERCLRRPVGGERCFEPSVLENNSVIVRIPETMLDVYAPLLRIMTAQCLTVLADRPLNRQHPILLALDEFAALGHLGNFVGALQTLRKRHVRILILTQSLADLDLFYSAAERTAMLNNFRYKIVLSASDPGSQEVFAGLIGHKTVMAAFHHLLGAVRFSHGH